MATWFERKKSGNGARRVLFKFSEALDVLYTEPDPSVAPTDQAQLDEQTAVMFQDCGPDSESD